MIGPPSQPAPKTARGPWLASRLGELGVLAAIVLASFAVRVPYLGVGPYGHDSRVYCIAALQYHVAHPPGYFGYVALGAALNVFVHHINLTFEFISVFSALVGTVLVYWLARAMGLSRQTARAAAIAYSISLSTLFYSVATANLVVEGMLVTLFALLAVRAMNGRRLGTALWATAVFALAGAIRPTTTMFLTPLWLYVLWQLRPGTKALTLHAVIALPIVLGCMATNSYLMERAGFQMGTLSSRIMMPANYDNASFSVETSHTAEAHPTYQLPTFELIAWVHDRLHLHLFPTGTQWPVPSLKRALTLIAMQACKFVFYLVWSAPLLLAVPLVWLWRYQTSQKNWRAGQVGQTWTTVPTWQRWFCFWWIAPATCFFVFGHMGTPGFIQVYLPGLCVLLCTYLLADAPQPAADPSAGQAPQTAILRWPMALVLALSFAGLLFFVGARPFDPAAKGWRGMANLLLLQYTGTGIRQELALARSGIWPPSREIQAMIDAQTDQQTIETAKKVDLLPIPKQK